MQTYQLCQPRSVTHISFCWYILYFYILISQMLKLHLQQWSMKSRSRLMRHISGLLHSGSRSLPVLMMMCQWALSHNVTHPNTLHAISAITHGAYIPQRCAVCWRCIWCVTCACLADWTDASLILPTLCWSRSTFSNLWPQQSWFFLPYISFPPLYCLNHH